MVCVCCYQVYQLLEGDKAVTSGNHYNKWQDLGPAFTENVVSTMCLSGSSVHRREAGLSSFDATRVLPASPLAGAGHHCHQCHLRDNTGAHHTEGCCARLDT
jgi:hypothetical protein